MNLTGNRKLIAFLAGTLANSLLVAFGKIDPGAYSALGISLVGAFFAGNVMAKSKSGGRRGLNLGRYSEAGVPFPAPAAAPMGPASLAYHARQHGRTVRGRDTGRGACLLCLV